MTRRRGATRSVLALLGGFTALATAFATGWPVPLTEASWNDTMHVNASLHASEHAGVNYARAVSSNGTLDRPSGLEPDIPGLQLNVNNIAGHRRLSPGPETYATLGLLGVISFDATSQSCARVGEVICDSPDSIGSPPTPAYAEAQFNSMSIAALSLLGLDVGPLAVYDANDPIVARASCTPGQPGTADVTFGGPIQLTTGSLLPPYRKIVPIPARNARSTASVTRLAKYEATVYNTQRAENGYSRAEVRLELTARTLLTDTTIWELNIILARAECGLSQGLGGGVVPAPAGLRSTMNFVMDKALATEAQEAETGTLHDAAAQANAPDPDGSATPTPPTGPPNDAETTAPQTSTGTTTPTGNGATRSSASRITRNTATVTSAPSSPAKPRTNTSSRSPSRPGGTTSQPTPSDTAPTRSSTGRTTAARPTTTAPGVTIPDDPSTLSPTARLEDVETITVREENLVVVIEGDTIPTDARQGATALEIWLSGGDPGTTWKTFASDDPDEDGWRWAAINQKTGTVVYIR
ncbi:hypothetical protein ACWGLC_10650 [Dietzia sp. NPDC055877]